MNRYIKFGAAAMAFSIALTSCKKDFLNTNSPSEYTPDVVYSSTAYTEFALNGVYALLTQDQMYSARLNLNYSTNSDIEFAGADANSYNDAGNRGLSNYVANSGNTQLAREWSTIYRYIERANLAIEGIQNSPLMNTADSTVMKAYLGEAITLRALGYFELVRHWGDVPFKKEPTKADLSNAFLPPTDRDTIYEELINDLLLAAEYTPWVGTGRYPTVEKITKGFIKGLIARIALARGGYSIRNKPGFPTERGSNWERFYEIARQQCLDIMNNGTHKLNTSYRDIWLNLNQLTVESTFRENMFEVAHGLSRSGEMGYSIGIRFFANPKYGFGNNANVVNTSAYYFYSFDQKDIRRDETVAWYVYGNSSGEAREFFTTNPVSYNFAKWDQRYMGDRFNAANQAAGGKFGYGVNWAIMRYADVLLMFAEAENALNGPTAAAKDALKQVRRRAFAEADRANLVEAYVDGLSSSTAFFNAIVNERAWEFGGEGIRKYDLIRWNLLVSKIQEQRDAFRKMFNREAPYDLLPTQLFYKYQPNNEIIDKTDINFFTDRGTADIPGYLRTPWLSGLSAANKTNFLQRVDLFSSGLNQNGVQNRHLFPIAASVIAESQGKLQNSYGFQ